jgi:hypothetical protein
MKNNTAYDFQAILDRLSDYPVLTAMMVSGLIFGVAASIAGVAVQRAEAACMTAENPAPPSASPVLLDRASGAVPLMNEALQARIVHTSNLVLSGDTAPAACPCATRIERHWQLI